jgi:EAL domain-containing protein (putative c-di-GMP-specific phosphodiesterase class I)
MERAHEGQEKALPESAGRVLVVEDEEPLLRAYGRMLEGAGFTTVLASSGREAMAAIEKDEVAAVVSDINMSNMDGMQLLRAVRERDLDLPVILVTGNPTIDTAARAVEYGALRYLVKPVEKIVLVETVGRAVKLHSIAHLKREAAAYLGTEDRMAGDRAGLEASLARGLDTLWMAYQPIVNPRRQQVIAFEALVRTREPTLPHPGVLFSVAEQLGRVHEVGRAIRASVARTLAERPIESDIFMNLHPTDLLDEALYSPDSPISPFARQVVLEITERAALDSGADIPGRIRRLRSLGFRVAIDDLGAGYAGLSYFALLTPDVVKLDITLVRNIHQEEIKRKLVGSLTSLCKDLGMLVVAEGVETAEERDTTLELGCDLLQGFLFAKPAPPFPEVSW